MTGVPVEGSYVLTLEHDEHLVAVVRVMPAEDVELVLTRSTALRRAGRYRLHRLGEGVTFQARGPLTPWEARQLAARVGAGEAA